LASFTLEEVEAENGYRFGFNGKEKDDELKGDGNSYDFGARMYDARLGKWLSLDPLEAKYPSHSAYSYSINSPIRYQDIDGNVIVDAAGNIAVFINNAGKPEFTKYATEDIKTTISLMTKTDVGTKIAEQMITSCNNIKIVIDTKTSGIWDNKEKKFVEETNENTFTKYGKTSTDTRPKDGTLPDVTITVYKKSFERDANSNNPDLVNSFGESYVQVPQFKSEDLMGGTFVHEGTHTTDPSSNSHTTTNPKNIEDLPKQKQLEHFRELDKNEKKDRILDKGEY
ncbi:MAG: RHS repeat-associated core domain-containing protein, partial [Bacteroidota bacterium]